jgi:hypothetical protein
MCAEHIIICTDLAAGRRVTNPTLLSDRHVAVTADTRSKRLWRQLWPALCCSAMTEALLNV